MSENKVVGGLSLGLFIIAIVILLFVGVILLFPPLQALIRIDAQALFIASDVFALFAALLGFLSRQTPPGKVGEIGGLVTFIPLTIFLSWILITGVQTKVISY